MSKITIKLSPIAPRALSRAPGEQLPPAEGGEPVIRRKRRVIVVSPQAAAAPAAPGKPTLAAKAVEPAPEPIKAETVPVPQQKPLSDDEKRRRRAVKAAAALDVLRQHFPGAFSAVRPLAIGIGDVVQDERKAGRLPLGVHPISVAMHAWVNADEYILALAAGGPRFNLAGEPEGEVSPEHAAAAAKKMEHRAKARAKREAKRKAQPQALTADTCQEDSREHL